MKIQIVRYKRLDHTVGLTDILKSVIEHTILESVHSVTLCQQYSIDLKRIYFCKVMYRTNSSRKYKLLWVFVDMVNENYSLNITMTKILYNVISKNQTNERILRIVLKSYFKYFK